MRAMLAAIGAVILLATAAPGAEQPVKLATVLERAAAYVADFHRQLSSIVAEEHYVQDWTQSRRGSRRVGPTALDTVSCVSDLLLVKPEASGRGWSSATSSRWTGCRSASAINGSTKMFLTPVRVDERADRQDPRRERALQHRRHQPQRQHAGLPSAVPGARTITTGSNSSRPTIDDRRRPRRWQRTARFACPPKYGSSRTRKRRPTR